MIIYNILNNISDEILSVVGVFVFITVIVFSTAKIFLNYKWSLKRIDKMKGDEFENFVKYCYETLGFSVEKTKKSGDQGIDLIIKKHFRKTGIQLKRYSGAVGNFAVQEVVAGKKYYKLDRVCVLTNSVFTKSAKELAKANGVELLDRNDLKKLIEKAKKKSRKR